MNFGGVGVITVYIAGEENFKEIVKIFFDFFYILKTLVNIFEVTKKSDSVEFLSPGTSTSEVYFEFLILVPVPVYTQ